MQYTFTPGCRPLGPLAALAVFGFPAMARTRRPVLVESRGSHEDWIGECLTDASQWMPRLLTTKQQPEAMDGADLVHGRAHLVVDETGVHIELSPNTRVDPEPLGECTKVWASDEETHYWDAEDVARAGIMAAVQSRRAQSSSVMDDLRAAQEALMADRRNWGGPLR